MKRILVRISAFLLCIITLVTTVACSNEKQSDVVTGKNYFNFKYGVHKLNYTETQNNLVSNGETDYVIVYPENPTKRTEFAVNELKDLFKEATGISLNAIPDSGVTYSSSAKFISLGKNGLTVSVGLNDVLDATDLDRDGFMIKTKGESIFIAGNSDFATIYGIYRFLEIEFDFDCFSNNYYYIDKGVQNVKLKNYDVVDVPDFRFRKLTQPIMTEKEQTVYRLGLSPATSFYLGDTSAHSSFVHLPKETYQKDHPKWYSVDGTQLCWTARGDEKELKIMQETIYNKMVNLLKNDPDGIIFSFTQADKYTWCTCDECSRETAKYNGSNAAVMVKCCNKIAEMVEEWMNSPDGVQYKRDFKIQFLAYNKTLGAPINYNKKTGKFSLIDGLKCHKNVSVYIAPIEMSFVKSIKDQENERFDLAIRGWAELCDEPAYFNYLCNYNNFMFSYDVFNTLQESYQMMACNNGFYYSSLGQYGQSGAVTGWQFLRSYLCAKLSWNVNIDFNTTIEKFFNHYYGAGANNMLKFFNEYRVQSKKITLDGTMKSTGVYGQVAGKKYFPLNMVKRWIDYCDKAIEDIYYLQKTDMAMYNTIYENIIAERVQLYYLIATYFSSDMDETYLTNIKEQCRADCNLVGITAQAEGVPISNLWTAWKLS